MLLKSQNNRRISEYVESFNRGRLTEDEAKGLVLKFAEEAGKKAADRAIVAIYSALLCAVVAPSLGLSAVLFAWAYSLVK